VESRLKGDGQRHLRVDAVVLCAETKTTSHDAHKMRLVPRRLDARGRIKPMRRVRKMRRPKGFQGEPLEVFATDTIERFRDG